MLTFDIVDVFADRPFEGNQLAVVHGAERLSTAQCQALATEFGFSETTFPTPRSGAPGAYDVRIFTPSTELPFAGHPTLGTAWTLARRGLVHGRELVQHCGAGPVPVALGESAGDDVRLTATPRDLLGPLPDELVAELAGTVGLALTDVAGPVFAAGTGLTWMHLPVVPGATGRVALGSGSAVGDLVPRLAGLGELRDPLDGIAVLEIGETRETGAADGVESVRVHSRVFVPGLGVDEDPATGSAAAGLGLALVAGGTLPRGGRYEIEQGVEMGRPSRLHGRVHTDADGTVTHVEVSGSVHHVASGEVAVPAPS